MSRIISCKKSPNTSNTKYRAKTDVAIKDTWRRIACMLAAVEPRDKKTLGT